jgi:hypothetical protein
LIRQVINRGYGTDFYAGDEDNGEQGAWFVLSALGFYSIVPGSVDYVITSPLFRHVRIDRSKDTPYSNYYEKPLTPSALSPLNNKQAEQQLLEEGDYLDLFAFGTNEGEEANSHKDESSSLFVDKVVVISDDDQNNEVVIDSSPSKNLLISDRLLQKKGFVRFVYENEKTLSSSSTVRFSQLGKSLHRKSTIQLEGGVGSSSSTFMNGDKKSLKPDPGSLVTGSTIADEGKDSEELSKLKKIIEDQSKKIQKLEKTSSFSSSSTPSPSLSSSSFSTMIFFILCFGFLFALIIAKLFVSYFDTRNEVSGNDGAVNQSCSNLNLYFLSVLRRVFLVLRSYYFTYVSPSSPAFSSTSSASGSFSSSNDPSSIPSTWSLKSQAHTV